MRSTTNKISTSFLVLVLLTGCGTNMDNYVSQVGELKNTATQRYGQNHGYNIHTLTGAKSVWQNKTCLDFFSNNGIAANSSNTFVRVSRDQESTALESARNACQKNTGETCLVVMLNDNCVLDQARTQAITPIAPAPTTTNYQMSIDQAKEKCTILGFNLGTEGFGKCVLQLTK